MSSASSDGENRPRASSVCCAELALKHQRKQPAGHPRRHAVNVHRGIHDAEEKYGDHRTLVEDPEWTMEEINNALLGRNVGPGLEAKFHRLRVHDPGSSDAGMERARGLLKVPGSAGTAVRWSSSESDRSVSPDISQSQPTLLPTTANRRKHKPLQLPPACSRPLGENASIQIGLSSSIPSIVSQTKLLRQKSQSEEALPTVVQENTKIAKERKKSALLQEVLDLCF